MDGGRSFVPATHQTGNTRRNEILRMLNRMLRTPTMGSHWEGHKWVFLSGNDVAEALLCNRKTADADLKALANAGFLVREKLGGKAQRLNGEFVSYQRRSWFYRFADGILNLCPWLTGNRAGNAKPTKRATDSPTTGQSNTHEAAHKNISKRGASSEAKTASTAVDRERRIQEQLQALVEAAIPGTCAAAPTNCSEQAQLGKENRQRKEREEIAAGHRTPEGGSTIPEWMKGWTKGDPLPGQPQQPALGFGAA